MSATTATTATVEKEAGFKAKLLQGLGHIGKHKMEYGAGALGTGGALEVLGVPAISGPAAATAKGLHGLGSHVLGSKGRSALEGATGGGGGAAAAQDERGGELVRQMLGGGVAIGGGLGAAVALINYLKSMREENEVEDESRLNDDTLYIPAVEKEASAEAPTRVNRWVAPGLAVTGGVLAAGGAYALTQAVYNYLQKKRRQKMLDEAQGEALQSADLEIAKEAMEKDAAKMNFYDLATAFPVAVPLLAALASGGVAYAALKKTFPAVKSPKSKHPRRIRQVAQTGAVSELPDDEEEDILKAASAAEVFAEQDLEDSGVEFLMMVVDGMAHEKQAMCLTSDILNRVANDGSISGLLQTNEDAGLEGIVEVTKGASDAPADMANKALAAATLMKSARLRPVVTALATAEFQELAPDLYDNMVSRGEAELEKFAGLASLMNLALVRPTALTKSAATNHLMEELEQLVAVPGALPGLGQVDPAEMDESLTTDATGAMSEVSEGPSTGEEILDADASSATSNAPADPVDEFMDMEGQSPLTNPIIEDDVASDGSAAIPL